MKYCIDCKYGHKPSGSYGSPRDYHCTHPEVSIEDYVTGKRYIEACPFCLDVRESKCGIDAKLFVEE